MGRVKLLAWYYAATVLFAVLDFGFDVNVRAAFLDAWPAARVAYYGFCFTCLAVMLWRPGWSALIVTLESLVALVALIFGMALRVMVPTDAIFGEHGNFVTYQEIINFVLAGFAAYFAWIQGLRHLMSDKNR